VDVVEGFFKRFAAHGGKHEAIACWQILFYALWHKIHVEGVVAGAGIMETLDSK
jgi:hypothetical protein